MQRNEPERDCGGVETVAKRAIEGPGLFVKLPHMAAIGTRAASKQGFTFTTGVPIGARLFSKNLEPRGPNPKDRGREGQVQGSIDILGYRRGRAYDEKEYIVLELVRVDGAESRLILWSETVEILVEALTNGIAEGVAGGLFGQRNR